MAVFAKALFWIPIGMIFFTAAGYLYSATRNTRTGMDPVMTYKEAVEFCKKEYVTVFLFAFVASLAANVTTLRIMIRSNTVRTRGWE